MSKALAVCAAGVHWGGADLKKALAHLPFLPLMQSQGAVFHTDAVDNPPGCDHLAQTTKLLLLIQTIPPFSVLNSWTFVFVSCVSVVWLQPVLWGWLTSVWGWLKEQLHLFRSWGSSLNVPFGPQRWWVALMATQWQDCRHRVDYRLPWCDPSACLIIRKPTSTIIWTFFLMEEPWGLVFCFINHNLKLMSREKDSYQLR